MEIIEDKTKVFGTKQEEGYWFKYVYITQTVGYCEDDYTGTIFIPLNKKEDNCKYLKFNYRM